MSPSASQMMCGQCCEERTGSGLVNESPSTFSAYSSVYELASGFNMKNVHTVYFDIIISVVERDGTYHVMIKTDVKVFYLIMLVHYNRSH